LLSGMGKMVLYTAVAAALGVLRGRPARSLAPMAIMGVALLCSACTHTRETCGSDPEACDLTPPNPVAALSDRAALKLLQHVNSAVNSRIPIDRRLQINTRDEWLPPRVTADGPVGDCKSFAAEKRHRLIAAGFPADRLSYAVVFQRALGLHALLVARLDRGDYILDSRQPWVTPWQDAGYTFVAFQQPGRPTEWRSVERTHERLTPIVEVQTTLIAAEAIAPAPTSISAPDLISPQVAVASLGSVDVVAAGGASPGVATVAASGSF